MNHQNPFLSNETRPLTLAAALLALSVAACTQNVDPVGGGTGGSGGDGGQSTTSSAGGNGTGNAGGDGGTGQGGNGTGNAPTYDHTGIAMLQSELPQGGTGGGGTSSSQSGGPEPDPNLLHVDISDIAISCTDPYGLECGGHFKVSFALPVELQHAGVYDMQVVDGFFLVTDDQDPVDCGGGGGSFWDGQVEITSIDDQQVVGSFIGTDTFDFDVNGTFVAVRCFQ